MGGQEEKGAPGHSLGKQTLVAVAGEENGSGIGRIRLRCISDASAASLRAFILEAAAPGSRIRTGCWPSHSKLHAVGYSHVTAVAGADPGRVDRDFPRLHRVAALPKHWLPGTHQGAVEKEHLNDYLDEFTFRSNPRTSRWHGLLLLQAPAADGCDRPGPLQHDHRLGQPGRKRRLCGV